MEEKILQTAGLTAIETKIYMAILKEGRSLAGRISRNTGVHRRSVYDSLERLIQKGLVSYIEENNKKYFFAEDPQNFLTMIDQQRKEISTIMPTLQILYTEKKQDRKTTFFRGKSGLKTIFSDQINEGKEVLIIGASLDADKIIKYYFPKYDTERKEKGIWLKMLFTIKNQEKAPKIPFTKIRYLPKNHKGLTATNIYGNKVAIIVWEKEPTAILIQDEAIAQTYREYFESLWNISRTDNEN
jgi:sugar-specific transcriptional regulator TrmB